MRTAFRDTGLNCRVILIDSLQARWIFLGFVVSVLLLVCSCAATTTTVPTRPEPGLFSLYLQPLPQETDRLTFRLGTMSARRIDGTEIPLSPRHTNFPAGQRVGQQVKLVSVNLPPGRYLGLSLQIDAASLRGADGNVDLLPPASALFAEHAFTVLEDRAEALFLSLSSERVVTDGVLFTPTFSLWKPERTLTSLKGFVSNTGAKSLTVFNKRSAQVIGAVRMDSQPMDQVLDQQRGWLYVAQAGADSIAVIETSTHEILGQVRLRSGDGPTELALSRSGKTLLALNQRSHSVSIVDTESLSERGRIRLDSEANDIVMGNDETVAYAIHSAASVVSALSLDSLSVRTSRIFDNSLLKGAVSDDGTTLYLATDFSPDLLVVDTASLSVRHKVFVGIGARTIRSDRVNGLLYVGKQDGAIAVVDPRALMAIDSYRLPGSVEFLTIDNDESALFALIPAINRLVKLDLISKQTTGLMEVDHESHAVAVMGER